MDPNEALAKMRAALAEYHDHIENDGGDWIGAAQVVAEHAEALDEWLTKGGFPPATWKRTVWSLTIYGDEQPLTTTLHASEDEAVESLEISHGDQVERESDSIISDLENWGYHITVDVHEI